MSASPHDVWVYAEHLAGAITGQTYEVLGKGRGLADELGERLVAILIGNNVEGLAHTLGAADNVLAVEDPQLEEFTPAGYTAMVEALARQHLPRLILFPATSMGMDLASVLAARLEMPLAVNCRDLRLEAGRLVATSQMCGGKLLCEMESSTDRAAATVLPGVFPAQDGMSERVAPLERVPLPAPLEGLRMRVTRVLRPEAGDVDITKAEVLVGVGRGIQRQENLSMAEEIAGLLGGAVCASRPVIDQGWLPLNRQVGKSGLAVKPKFYLALGISGASEHVEGMKDADLIIAVNTDAKAPIYDVADYGVAADLFDLVPALADELKARKASAA